MMEYQLNVDSRPMLASKSVERHLEFLKHSFYKIDSKWPQFKVLFEQLDVLRNRLAKGSKVLILERCYFYGGYTLIGPIFSDHEVQVVDCQNTGSKERFGQQISWLDDDRVIRWRADKVSPISDLSFYDDEYFDVIIVPNVVHHERDQYKMFAELSRTLRSGGECHIFEGLVRELHHMPEDYVRYTPEGIREMFNKVGLELTNCAYGSGIFDVISYVWMNAIEYLPVELRKETESWFYDEHYPYLQDLDKRFGLKNLEKPDKLFPMSYFVTGRKSN